MIVYIKPEVINAATESEFYLDQITFSLTSDSSQFLISNPISVWGIDNFTSEIGSSYCKFVIGTIKSTVITTYPVQINKNEKSGQIYSELPLLKVKVIKTKYDLEVPSAINTYIGKKSNYLVVQPPLITITDPNGAITDMSLLPAYTVVFDIVWAVPPPAGLTFTNNQQQFSLALETPESFLEIQCDSTLTAGATYDFVIKPVSSTAQFNEKSITITVQTPPTGVPTFAASLSSATLYTATISMNCSQEVFIFYYAMPFDSYKEHSRSTVKAWVMSGYRSIETNTVVGYYSYQLTDNSAVTTV